MYKMKITTITVYWTTKIRSKYLVLGPGAQKLFGYRVAHHGYILTSCPGQSVCKPGLPQGQENRKSWEKIKRMTKVRKLDKI